MFFDYRYFKICILIFFPKFSKMSQFHENLFSSIFELEYQSSSRSGEDVFEHYRCALGAKTITSWSWHVFSWIFRMLQLPERAGRAFFGARQRKFLTKYISFDCLITLLAQKLQSSLTLKSNMIFAKTAVFCKSPTIFDLIFLNSWVMA